MLNNRDVKSKMLQKCSIYVILTVFNPEGLFVIPTSVRHVILSWFILLVPVLSIAAENELDSIDITVQSRQPYISFNGQLTGWGAVQLANPAVWVSGGRFVPTLTGGYSTKSGRGWDAEASLNMNGSSLWMPDSVADYSGQLKPYRIWLRYHTRHFEVRAGLQKINFGAAKLLRPLMWFDGMDIRDPLQLTDGVYGLLSRYFFDNNTTLWGWMLIGNKKPKGYEWIGSDRRQPEMGGRLELPVGPGEIGLSYHHRKTVLLLAENRFGFDGKWDLGVGLWVEGSLTALENSQQLVVPKRTDLFNLGIDYTLPLANGVGVTLEYFRYHAGNRFFTGGTTANVLSSMLSYPVSLIDNVSLMVFCLPSSQQTVWMHYASWGRTYDNLSVYLIGFITPVGYSLPVSASKDRNLFAGKGFQLMLSYNF